MGGISRPRRRTTTALMRAHLGDEGIGGDPGSQGGIHAYKQSRGTGGAAGHESERAYGRGRNRRRERRGRKSRRDKFNGRTWGKPGSGEVGQDDPAQGAFAPEANSADHPAALSRKAGDLFPFAGSRTGCDDSGSDEEPYKGEGNNEVMHGWFSLGKSNEITHNMIIGQVRKFMNTTSILGRCLDGYYSYHFRCIVRYPCVQE